MSKPLTHDNIIKEPIDSLDTWPFIPRDFIQQTPFGDEQKVSESSLSWYLHYCESVEHIIDAFSDHRNTLIGFLTAVLIGVVCSLAVSALFGGPTASLWYLSLLFFIIFGLLVYFYIYYLTPQVSLIVEWWPVNLLYVPNRNKIQVPNIDPFEAEENIYALVNLFVLALIRDTICRVELNMFKPFNVKRIFGGQAPSFQLEFRLSSRFSLLKTDVTNLRNEALQIVGELFMSIQNFNARAIDYRTDKWSQFGSLFIANMLNLKSDELQKELMDQIMHKKK